ncbi:DUF2777 family protein [Cohnella laeviribosi]|uniref:DUF2777 family protein n=1 Tax=Cohnella laeviribosi TaxID=380174 RepID=UPI0003616143|nr:DUF2777 family protein [Cohnella laeviribosi]
MSYDYYDAFGKELGKLSEFNGQIYFSGRDIGEIEIKNGDIIDFYIDGEWVPYRYDGRSFVNRENSDIKFFTAGKARYHRPIDTYMKARLDQILHPESFRILTGKLYSIKHLTLFDCMLFRESGEFLESLIKGNHFLFFENVHTYCSVHHYYERVEDKHIPGGYRFISDRFEFMTMDGQQFTETYEKTFEPAFEKPIKNDDFEEEYMEYLRKKGLVE